MTYIDSQENYKLREEELTRINALIDRFGGGKVAREVAADTAMLHLLTLELDQVEPCFYPNTYTDDMDHEIQEAPAYNRQVIPITRRVS